MRRSDREIKDKEKILEIVSKAKVLHLGLFDGKYPYVVPLHYGFEIKDGKFVFYMHSATEGHKLDLIRENPNVCVELESDVSAVSGGEIPCKYSSNYASVIGRGEARIAEGVQEKIKGLKLLMSNQTGRSFEIDEKMTSGVEVIKVVIESLTAKARQQ